MSQQNWQFYDLGGWKIPDERPWAARYVAPTREWLVGGFLNANPYHGILRKFNGKAWLDLSDVWNKAFPGFRPGQMATDAKRVLIAADSLGNNRKLIFYDGVKLQELPNSAFTCAVTGVETDGAGNWVITGWDGNDTDAMGLYLLTPDGTLGHVPNIGGITGAWASTYLPQTREYYFGFHGQYGIAAFQPPSTVNTFGAPHTHTVMGVAASPSRGEFIAGSNDGTLATWTPSGKWHVISSSLFACVGAHWGEAAGFYLVQAGDWGYPNPFEVSSLREQFAANPIPHLYRYTPDTDKLEDLTAQSPNSPLAYNPGIDYNGTYFLLAGQYGVQAYSPTSNLGGGISVSGIVLLAAALIAPVAALGIFVARRGRR